MCTIYYIHNKLYIYNNLYCYVRIQYIVSTIIEVDLFIYFIVVSYAVIFVGMFIIKLFLYVNVYFLHIIKL